MDSIDKDRARDVCDEVGLGYRSGKLVGRLERVSPEEAERARTLMAAALQREQDAEVTE